MWTPLSYPCPWSNQKVHHIPTQNLYVIQKEEKIKKHKSLSASYGITKACLQLIIEFPLPQLDCLSHELHRKTVINSLLISDMLPTWWCLSLKTLNSMMDLNIKNMLSATFYKSKEKVSSILLWERRVSESETWFWMGREHYINAMKENKKKRRENNSYN